MVSLTMNDDFQSLYDFNRWADRRVFQACRALAPEQYIAEPVEGWSTVRSTIVHIAIVTEGWIRGLTGENVASAPTEAELPTLEDAERHLDKAYVTLEGLWPTLTPSALATPRVMRGGGRAAVLPPWVVLRHVVNHATYHRGQVASKLKRFGVETPPTDLVFWAFEQLPQPA
jgi:uncharacterized damage-inducible protein DinB